MAKKQKLDFTPTGSGLANPFVALSFDGSGGEPSEPASSKQQPAAEPSVPKPSKFGRVVLRREKAHRGGKTVIVIHDFAPNIGLAYIDDLAAKLKSACGCGGTTKDRSIE